MQEAFRAFVTIWLVMAVGWTLAHLGILNKHGRDLIANLAFSVGSPALLLMLVSRANLGHLFSRTLVVSILAIAGTVVIYAVLARWVLRQSLASAVIGTLTSAYINSAYLGFPIAAYVLGDMTWMAPILLLQVGLLQPTALLILDIQAAKARGVALAWHSYLTLPFRNPITVGVLAGLALNLVGWRVPELLAAPLDLIGAITVPSMLLAFGVSLRLDPLPGGGPHARAIWLVAMLKALVHPAVALALGALVFHLSKDHLLAVTVIAALPTAQNIYVIANRYRVEELLARDGTFWSTLLSVPVIMAASTLLR